MTEDDTFNKLRRVSYEEACTIYTMACIYLKSGISTKEINEAVKEDLRVAGWTIDNLRDESLRLHNLEMATRQTDPEDYAHYRD
jgi:hypothetical protein